MKPSILAIILASIFSLFGLHQPLAYHAPTVPPSSALAAAAATSVELTQPPTEHFITYTLQPGDTLSGIAQAFSIPVSNILAANDLSQRAILHPGGQLIIPDPQTAPATSAESPQSIATPNQTTHSTFIKSAASSATPAAPFNASAFVTQAQYDAGLSALGESLRQLISYEQSAPLISGAGAPLSAAAFAPSQRINQLDNVTIDNATVSNVAGLSASDIPALDYFPLSGGPLSGNLQVSGNATTTGTSYFAGNVGIGTSTSQDALAVSGSEFLPNISAPGITTNRLYANGGGLYWAGSLLAGASTGNWTSDGTNVWRPGGNVGIGTTSPFATLSVVGNGYFSGPFAASGISASNATTTNLVTTNATSTNIAVSGTASTSALIVSNSFTLGSLTGFLKATAGSVTTSLVNLAGDVTGVLPVANGGTGWSNLAAGAIPYGNGTSALATTSAGTSGYVLAYLNGVPTWTASTTLSTISGTLTVNQGGTGSTTLTGLLKGNGAGTIQSAIGGTDYEFPLAFSSPLLSVISLFDGCSCALFDGRMGCGSAPDATERAAVLAAVKDATRRWRGGPKTGHP